LVWVSLAQLLLLALRGLGISVLAIDKNPEAVNEIKDKVSFAEIIDATNFEYLKHPA